MEWRPVVGFEGLYEVSSDGQVRGLDRFRLGRWGNQVPVPGVLKKSRINRYGYVEYRLGAGSAKKVVKTAHTLVLEAFVGPRPEGMQCNHKNTDRADNRVENLEWVTASENCLHRQACGTGLKGERTAKAKLTEADVQEVRRLRAEGWSQQRIADKFGVAQPSISSLLRGKSWAHVSLGGLNASS